MTILAILLILGAGVLGFWGGRFYERQSIADGLRGFLLGLKQPKDAHAGDTLRENQIYTNGFMDAKKALQAELDRRAP